MENFWVVTLFHLMPSRQDLEQIQAIGVSEFNCQGVEEFALGEEEVDKILGERSYSGGDLPVEVLEKVEMEVLSSPQSFRFFFQSESDGKEFLEALRSKYLCESQLEKKEVQDWNAEWKKHYRPITIDSSLQIIPSWMKDFRSSSDHKLYIYPGMGFGTGSHETTYLCLKLFTKHISKKVVFDILDFGSGSGILGLAALRFFPAARVDFYDIDPEANRNCYQNALENNLEDKSFRLLLPEVRGDLLKEYDVIFANILASILLEEKEALQGYTKLNGYLILSGVLKPQAAMVIESYQSSKFKLIEQLDKGEWVAMIFQRI